MPRIAGVELPEEKRIDYALTLLYGVGWPVSRTVLNKVGIDPAKKVKEIGDQELARLSREIENLTIEGALKHEIRENIQRLTAIGTYRGHRHLRNLPVRGQRTKTNARTKRGKRKTVGAFKKEMLARQQQQKTAAKA